MIAIIIALGMFDVYDFVIPETVGYVANIGICEEASLAKETDSSWKSLSDDLDYNWGKLQPSVKVLRKVCPAAASWVEDRHQNNKIVWDNTKDGTYARYDNIKGTLFINEASLLRRQGDMAATLAHEYRHSRQNFTKTMKVAMFYAFTGVELTYLVENDACLFEKEVYIAIFG